jgi:glycolate oxidase iron-sulfur subunit
MQTSFTLAQLADPNIAEADRILRSCVHCGFCTATCPTYVLLGDELDSPRGRIYLIKDMLENERPATPDVVKHIDRCLSCLSCMTTCPSGVHYMHLVDHARAHIESSYRRPPIDRLIRALLARVLPRNDFLRWALVAARPARPFAGLFTALGLERLAALLRLAPVQRPAKPVIAGRRRYPPQGSRRGRVGLLAGCVAPVIAPSISESTIRLLTRHGIEVVVADAGCCGSLVHHMGRKQEALATARRQIDAWIAEMQADGLDGLLITASGCGTTVKDYGYMLRSEADISQAAAAVSAKTRDVTEYLASLGVAGSARRLKVAYHSACSMQHGQGISEPPRALLKAAGFDVVEIPEGHLCCGSAGTYNLLQPELSRQLRDRKAANIAKTAPDLVATGNIGCLQQLAGAVEVPIVHTVELLDWASGGPMPAELSKLKTA